jgi:hypothetical protein
MKRGFAALAKGNFYQNLQRTTGMGPWVNAKAKIGRFISNFRDK